MITIQENGKTCSIVNSREKWIEINGVRYPFPKRVKGHSVFKLIIIFLLMVMNLKMASLKEL